MSTRFIIGLAIAALSVHPASGADEPYEPLYHVWFEAGAAFPQSTDLHSFPGAPGAHELEFHPGARLALGVEYDVTPYFAINWEIGVIVNSVDSASNLQKFDALLTQIPMLVSAMFQYQNQTHFTPFLGVGGGGGTTALDIDDARNGAITVDGSDYDLVPAWQAFAGVKYELKPGLTLGVAYKYLWMGGASWNLDDSGASGTSDDLEMDSLGTHSILAFISYRF